MILKIRRNVHKSWEIQGKVFFIFNPLSITKVTNIFIPRCCRNKPTPIFTQKLMNFSSYHGNVHFFLSLVNTKDIGVDHFLIISQLHFFPQLLMPHNLSLNLEVIILLILSLFFKVISFFTPQWTSKDYRSLVQPRMSPRCGFWLELEAIFCIDT